MVTKLDPAQPLQSHLGRALCACPNLTSICQLIAITGGPGAGKTALLNLAQNLLCSHNAFLPEAATIIFSGGFWRLPSANGLRAAQTAIFHVQSQLESMLIGESAASIALCDRGTIDGSAYWPTGFGDYWATLGTTREKELSRYKAVIHLRCPKGEEGFNHSNPQRVETAETADRIDQAILRAWDGHPNRIVIDSSIDFRSKMNQAMDSLIRIIALLQIKS